MSVFLSLVRARIQRLTPVLNAFWLRLKTQGRTQFVVALVFVGLLLSIYGLLGLARMWWVPMPKAPTAQAVPGVVENARVIRFASDAPQLAYLRIAPAGLEPVPLLESFTGQISYDDNRTGRVFAPVNGRVLKALAQTGDVVSPGQAIVQLDAPDYADLAKASSQLKTSQAAYARTKVLFEADVLARKDMELAANELHQAEADQARARSKLRYLRPQQDAVALLAPLGGVVMERQISPGMEVSPSADQPLMVISDPTHLWVMAELPEQSLGKLRAGQVISVSVDAYPSEIFLGRVDAVGDVLDPQTRRVLVRCSVPNPARLLKPGMYARVTPVNGDHALPRVANAALVTEGLKIFLFVETAPGVLEKREVELAFRGQEHSYVSKGISGGERVVFAGAVLLNAELAGN